MRRLDLFELTGGFVRQKQHGTLVTARIYPRDSLLTSRQMRAVADIAERHGERVVLLTASRAIEVPHIADTDQEPVRRALQQAGIDLRAGRGREAEAADFDGPDRSLPPDSPQPYPVRLPIHPVPVRVLRSLAGVAESLGNGNLRLTSRQGIEILAIRPSKFEAVKARLDENYLSPGVTGPRGRSATWCEGPLLCPHAQYDNLSLARRLDELIFGRDLPRPLTACVSACHRECALPAENDIAVMGNRDAGKNGYSIWIGGRAGRGTRKPLQLVKFIPDDETYKVLHVIRICLEFYRDQGKPGEAIADTFQRTGLDPLRTELGILLSTSTPTGVKMPPREGGGGSHTTGM